MVKDIAGQRFGRLVAIKPNGKQFNNTKWLCKCDCGNFTTTNISSLTRGVCKSCGCLRKELTAAKFKTHGCTRTKLYAVYRTMRARCEKPKDSHYKYYGGKGIKVCDEWKENFKTFHDWAISNGYKEGMTIDRIDINKNYEPSNCRWVDMIVQANNKSNNNFITYNGETHTIAEWASIKDLTYATLYQRIMKHKWTIERALTTKQNKRRITK